MTTGIVHLTDRTPQMTGEEMVSALVPPRQFHTASFDSYRPDAAYPSQDGAKHTLAQFVAPATAPPRARLFHRARKAAEPTKPGVYLDGGFGVGKTHLLAAVYHAQPAGPKYFGSFIEYTALVGALGYRKTVEQFTGAKLLCIDEFELDDPGDTMMMSRLLGELVAGGTKLAATSNTPPGALGEGRFAAEDFLREIQAMADSFRTLRIDGTDYRQRAVDGTTPVLSAAEYATAVADASGRVVASDDVFGDVIAHLAHVHPSRYVRLIDGVGLLGLRDVVQLEDQSAALRFVAFVDRAYDAQIPVRATGHPLGDVFSAEMLAGGYRKKYQRAMSRLIALTTAS